MAYLHVVYTNGHELKFELSKALVRLGRHSVNDLQLADDAASRLHCEICRKPGQYIIRDLKSKNGVQVNGQTISEHALADGDKISIGNVSMQFCLAENESLADTRDVDLIEGAPEEGPIVQAKRSMSDSQILKATWSPPGAADLTVLQNRLKSITALCRFLMTARSPDDLISETMEEIVRHLPYDRGCIMLRESDQDQLVAKVMRDNRPAKAPDSKLAVSLTIAETCLRERSGVLCTDATRDKRFSASDSIHALELHSVLCVPLLGSARPLGIIHLESRADRYEFNEMDLDYLMGIAGELSVGLEHLQLREARGRAERIGLINETISGLIVHVQGILKTAEKANRLIEEAVASSDLEGVKKGLKTVRRNSEKIGHLLSDMVEYSHLRMGEAVLGNVNTVVTEAVEELAAMARRRGVEPIVQLDERLADGYIVPDALRHLVRNLLLNALDAVEGAEESEVVIITDQAGEGLANIVVQDSGAGLSLEDKDRVFQPFSSPEGTPGTGLRLALVHKLAIEIGGRIECETEAGLGTTFIVTVPTPKTPPSAALEEKPQDDRDDRASFFDEDL